MDFAFPFRLLRESLELYKRNAALIAGYAAWLLLPFVGIVLISFLPQDDPAVSIITLLLVATQVVLWVWVTIVITKAAAALARKKQVRPAKIQKEGWSRLAAVALVILLQLVALAGGLILFVIPGLVFFIWFALSQPAAILDGKRSIEALSASRKLVAGRFWETAWKVVGGPLLLVILYSVALAVVTYAGLAGTLTELPSEAGAQFFAEPPLWLAVADALGDAFVLTPLLTIYSALLYLHLKETKG